MNYNNNIKFFATLGEAMEYQNGIEGGALYVSGNNSKTQFEYDIAAYILGIEEEKELEKLGRFCVVDEFTRARVIERPCFIIK